MHEPRGNKGGGINIKGHLKISLTCAGGIGENNGSLAAPKFYWVDNDVLSPGNPGLRRIFLCGKRPCAGKGIHVIKTHGFLTCRNGLGTAGLILGLNSHDLSHVILKSSPAGCREYQFMNGQNNRNYWFRWKIFSGKNPVPVLAVSLASHRIIITHTQPDRLIGNSICKSLSGSQSIFILYIKRACVCIVY